MALKSLQLDPYLLAGLYPEPLVATRSAHSPEGPILVGKPILIAYRKREKGDLPENQRDFLNKMILACKLNPDEVAIADAREYDSLEELLGAHHPRVGLLFGLDPGPSGEQYAPFRQHQAEVVFADDLESLTSDPQLKSRLWKALRLLFQI